MPLTKMSLSEPDRIEAGPLVREDGELREPGPRELAIDVRACAICRTDLQLVTGDLRARRLPIVPGHQIVGVVAAIGRDVEGWSIGDRVGAGWLASACGECEQCVRGRENLCERARFTGWDVDGGYATGALVDARFAFRIPDGFDDTQAAPLLCGGVIGYRSLQRARVRPGDRVGLYGFGASASLALQVARHWDCRVFVATRSEAEQERARSMGAEWAGAYDDTPPAELDAAVTFAPSGEVVVHALSALARGGTVAINAIHLDRIPSFSYDLLWWEKNLASVANYTRADAQALLELAAKIPIRTRVEVLPLAQANEALLRLRDGALAGTAVLVP